jgi:hypothetical protein
MPGTLVQDTNAPTLFDGTAQTASTDGAWTYCPGRGCQRARLSLGACSGTSVLGRIWLEMADDSGGTNAVEIGAFESVTDADDNLVAYLDVYIDRKYVRARSAISGTSPSITPTVKLHHAHYLRKKGDSSDPS